MRRRQPNRVAAILAALIAVTVPIAKRLLDRADDTGVKLLTAWVILLALAYLASVFLLKPDRKKRTEQDERIGGNEDGSKSA